MNHLLYNLSIIIIIMGIILFTHTISISSKKCDCSQVLDYVPQKKPLAKDIPSVFFKKMFDSPSVWIGYGNENDYAKFDDKV